MSELACQSAAAILVSSEAKDLPVRPDRKGGHLHHRRASLASFPSFQGAIIIKGIEQVFRGFAAHRCWDMGSEEEEPNLSENLLTVRKEQSGLFTPRLEHIKACARVGGRVIQVMTVASEGDITQGTRESEGIYIPSEGVLASGTYESRRHEGSAESTVMVRDANGVVLSEGVQEVPSALAQSAKAIRPGGVRFRTCVSNVAAHGNGINRTS
jgi:hypothetical protein